MPKRNRHQAYWLDRLDSVVIEACRDCIDKGILFPNMEDVYLIVIANTSIFHVHERLSDSSLHEVMDLVEPKKDGESWDDRRLRFFNNLREGGYHFIYDKEETKAIPAFATEPTGIDVLQEIWNDPYRDTAEIAESIHVSPSTVRYHIRRACELAGIRGKYLQFQLRDRFLEDEFVFFPRERK